MSIWIILIIVLAGLAFLTHPSLNCKKVRRWRGERFAHRGLHGPNTGLVENTLPAFEAARDAGYGMELDIQFSRWWCFTTTTCSECAATRARCAS